MTVVQCKLDSAQHLPILTELAPMDARNLRLGYVFRGQSARHTTLIPKAERAFKGDLSHALFGKRHDLEAVQLQYRRVIHNVQPAVPPDTTWLEWQAMIQHYGGPTRLLDVTVSPLVAAYFACQACDPEQGTCIWCIRQDESEITSIIEDMLHYSDGARPPAQDEEEARERAQERYQEAVSLLFGLWEGAAQAVNKVRAFHTGEVIDSLMRQLSEEDRKALQLNHTKVLDPFSEIVFVRPFRMNARLLAQQGAFAMVLNHRNDFMNCLVKDEAERAKLAQPDWGNLPLLSEVVKQVQDDATVARIWIPPKMAREIDYLLMRYNVTGFSLFPDFHGFTQSLNDVQRLYEGFNPFK